MCSDKEMVTRTNFLTGLNLKISNYMYNCNFNCNFRNIILIMLRKEIQELIQQITKQYLFRADCVCINFRFNYFYPFVTKVKLFKIISLDKPQLCKAWRDGIKAYTYHKSRFPKRTS